MQRCVDELLEEPYPAGTKGKKGKREGTPAKKQRSTLKCKIERAIYSAYTQEYECTGLGPSQLGEEGKSKTAQSIR